MLAATLPVLSMTLPATASAAPAGAVVVIGDSFATNHSDDLGPACGHSPTSLAGPAGWRTGDHLINVSCSGASLFGRYNVYDQAKKAQKRNGFGPGPAPSWCSSASTTGAATGSTGAAWQPNAPTTANCAP